MATNISPLSTSLSINYGSMIASYDNIHREEVVDRPDEGKVPMFILFGPRLKLKRILKLYYFVLVFMIFRLYYKNGGTLMTTIMKSTFFPNGSSQSENSGDPFVYDHPYINYWFQSFGIAIPGMLSIIIAFVADYYKYERANLINYSLGISSFSAFVKVICSYNLQYTNDSLQDLYKALSIIVLISFVLGLAIYLPTSLAYGLDILQGTSWKVIYLYFPLMYFVNNISTLLSYLTYLDPAEEYLPNHCLINLATVLLAWILCIIGRSCGFISYYDQTMKVDITFKEAISIIWYALRKRMSNLKVPGHWFLQMASEKYYGKFKHEKVQIVSSFLRLIFLLSIPQVAYVGYQMIETGFPNQGYMLTIPTLSNISQQEVFCEDQKITYINNLTFINYISIILAIPFFEYFFWNVSFYVDANKEPYYIKCIQVAGIRNCVKRIQNAVRDYFHPLDPILKKMFWGLFFGLFSIICAFYVEIARISTIDYNYRLYKCEEQKFNHTYKISGISVFSQVPQYMFSGLLEVLLFVGVQQFVYFQCYTTFKGAFKSYFMSLYYFNVCLGVMISDTVYMFLDYICKKSDCGNCVIYNDTCSEQNFGYAWLVWMVFIILYLIIIGILGTFSHYRYWQAKMMIFEGVDYDDHIASLRDVEG